MIRNPLLNALAAIGYILLLALSFTLVARFLPEPTSPIGPILGFLSIFVLSAAITGYAIIGMPLRLFLEGEKKEAVALFGKTLLAFAALAVILFLLSFLIPQGILGPTN